MLPATFQTTGMGSIWFHAVSVGEVLSAVELIRRLRAAVRPSDIFVSTTTLAGRATAEQRLADLANGIFYAPLDYRSSFAACCGRLRPAAGGDGDRDLAESLSRSEARRRVAADRQRPHLGSCIAAIPALELVFPPRSAQPDAIWCRPQQDAGRYVIAGAPAERVRSAGNLKYDFTPPTEIAPDIADFLDGWQPHKVWIAASTMPPAAAGDPDEDEP